MDKQSKIMDKEAKILEKLEDGVSTHVERMATMVHQLGQIANASMSQQIEDQSSSVSEVNPMSICNEIDERSEISFQESPILIGE